MKRLPLTGILPFCILVILGCTNDSEVRAQGFPSANCDAENVADTNKKGWPQGATVSVYIDPAIVGQRRSAVTTAFDNWTQKPQSERLASQVSNRISAASSRHRV